MADSTINYGFPYPEGGDKVAVHSDVAKVAKAADAEALQTNIRIDDAEAAIEDARWLRGNALSTDTLTSLPEGISRVRSGVVAQALGLPVIAIGTVTKTLVDGTSGIVTYEARRAAGKAETYRIVSIGGVWQEWERTDAGAIEVPSPATGHINLWGSSTPAGLHTRLSDAVEPYSVGVHSYARGGQWSSQTVANTSMPVPLPIQGGSIPASGSVEINAADSVLDGVDLYLAPTDDGIPGWLGGVYGRLVGYGTTFTDRGIRFERDRPGAAVSPTEQPDWIADVSTPANMNVINAGKNDLTVGTPSAQALAVIERRDALVQMWRDRGQDFLILGHFVNTGTAASATTRTYVEADNVDAAAKYPDNYLSMQALVTAPDVWEWTGVTPTSTDRSEQALGNLPPSIAGNLNHFNDIGYQWIAHNIQQWLLSTGRIGAGRVPFGNRPAQVSYLGDGVYEIA